MPQNQINSSLDPQIEPVQPVNHGGSQSIPEAQPSNHVQNDQNGVKMLQNPSDVFVPQVNFAQKSENEDQNSADILDQNGIFCESNQIEFHCGRSGPPGSGHQGQAINGHQVDLRAA